MCSTGTASLFLGRLAPSNLPVPMNMSPSSHSLASTAVTVGVSAVTATVGALEGTSFPQLAASSLNTSLSPTAPSSPPGAGLDPAAYILCMIQQKQQQLLDAAANAHSKLDAANGSTTATASSAFVDFEELYSREIIRLAMEFNRQQLTPQEILVIIMYGLVVLVSLFGNLLVCKVILFKKSMRRRTTNVLIMNLTVADLSMTLYTIPMFIIRNISDNWPFGELLCKGIPFVQALSVYVSVLSMTMIAIDRYQALIKPLKRRMSHRVPKSFLIAFIWVVSAILAAPNAVFNIVAEVKMLNTIVPSTVATTGDPGAGIESGQIVNEEILYRCKTVYSDGNDVLYQRISTCVAFTTQFLVPLFIVGLCYTMIGLKISKRTCIGETTVEQAQSHLNAKRKTIKMLCCCVLCFLVCWLPYNLLYLFKDFGDLNFSLTLHYITHWLAMSSVVYNPFIYFWLNNGYRQGILSVLTCCFSSSSMVAQSTDPEQNRTTIFQRSLSRSYSSGSHYQPNTHPHLNYINNLNNSNSNNINNNNNNHNLAANSSKLGDKEINLSRLKSNLLSVPTFSNANQNSNKNSDSSNNNCSGNSNGSAGATSRHLQIIYISLKEKYSKDDDDEEETEDVELSHSKSEESCSNARRHKKSSTTRISSEMTTDTDGEYFELMECIHQEKAGHLEEETDVGLKFKCG